MSKPTKLFEEFAPVTTEAWLDVVKADLKGAEYEKALVKKVEESLKVQAVYRSENLPSSEWLGSAVRGWGGETNAWSIRQEILERDPVKAGALARTALEWGAHEAAFVLGAGGVQAKSAKDFENMLAGLALDKTPIRIDAGPLSAQALALWVNAAEKRDVPAHRLHGGVDHDPLLFGAAGLMENGLDNWVEQALPVATVDVEQLPSARTLAIHADLVQEAGGTSIQQLAIALAVLVEYINGLNELGLSPERVVPQIELRFGVGSKYFVEIAKLRASRLLVRRVLDAYKVGDVRPKFHAVTSRSNMSAYDPHVNMLRATTEAMSAVVGGVDSLSVRAYDRPWSEGNEFSMRIARNVQILLRDEAYLDKVVDPAGGSYAVESLTHSIAVEAWKLFQKIEAAGGFVAAWKSGLIPEELKRSRDDKLKLVAGRREPILGVSLQPDAAETHYPIELAPPQDAVTKAFGKGSSFELLRGMLKEGETLDTWTATTAPESPLSPLRLAAPFEALRLAVEKHVDGGGEKPLVFLALLGDKKMRKARAGFVSAFFGCGEYGIKQGAFDDAEAAAKAAAGAGANVVVLCSSDPEYVTHTAPMKKALEANKWKAKLVVAGYPTDAIEQLKADGAEDFIHIKLDAVATLARYHKEMGIAL